MNDVELAKKNDMLFKLCNRWLYLKIKGKEIADYLKKEHINEVAIYGCGELGRRLMEDLLKTEINVIAGIDIDIMHVDVPLEVIPPTSEYMKKWENADALIITPIYYYNEIFVQIKTLGYKNQILALNDILMNM